MFWNIHQQSERTKLRRTLLSKVCERIPRENHDRLVLPIPHDTAVDDPRIRLKFHIVTVLREELFRSRLSHKHDKVAGMPRNLEPETLVKYPRIADRTRRNHHSGDRPDRTCPRRNRHDRCLDRKSHQHWHDAQANSGPENSHLRFIARHPRTQVSPKRCTQADPLQPLRLHYFHHNLLPNPSPSRSTSS
jgi:hypothetical protein